MVREPDSSERGRRDAAGHPARPDRRSKPGKIGSVVSRLGLAVARGDFPPGQALPPEPVLEQVCGAGRGVVREAIKILASKGLLTVRPRIGTHVRPRAEWQLLDREVLSWIVQAGIDRDLLLALDETRGIIEPEAAALAAERATDADRLRIRGAYEAMASHHRDVTLATEADKRFHLAILDATHNPVLCSFRNGIDAILSAVFDVTVPMLEPNLPNHEAVARAIEAGRADEARAAMIRLLGRTHRLLAGASDAASGRSTSRDAA